MRRKKIGDCPYFYTIFIFLHVTQRGNNRQEVFFVDDDRRFYLDLLAGQAQRFGLDVLGYCLMSNHIHLIAVPQPEESLAKA